jgi:hypothetical protein
MNRGISVTLAPLSYKFALLNNCMGKISIALPNCSVVSVVCNNDVHFPSMKSMLFTRLHYSTSSSSNNAFRLTRVVPNIRLHPVYSRISAIRYPNIRLNEININLIYCSCTTSKVAGSDFSFTQLFLAKTNPFNKINLYSNKSKNFHQAVLPVNGNLVLLEIFSRTIKVD